MPEDTTSHDNVTSISHNSTAKTLRDDFDKEWKSKLSGQRRVVISAIRATKNEKLKLKNLINDYMEEKLDLDEAIEDSVYV